MSSSRRMSANVRAQSPPIEWPIRTIGAGILAVIDNGLRGNQPADRELVDIGLDAGLFELIGQLVHPARKDRTERTAEQIDARFRRCRGLPRLGRRDRQVRRSRRIARRHGGLRQCRLRTGHEDAGRQHGACHDGCKLSWIDHVLSARVFDVGHVQPWRARGMPPGPTGCLVAEEWAEFAARGRNGAAGFDPIRTGASRFATVNRHPPRIKSGAGFRSKRWRLIDCARSQPLPHSGPVLPRGLQVAASAPLGSPPIRRTLPHRWRRSPCAA